MWVRERVEKNQQRAEGWQTHGCMQLLELFKQSDRVPLIVCDSLCVCVSVHYWPVLLKRGEWAPVNGHVHLYKPQKGLMLTPVAMTFSFPLSQHPITSTDSHSHTKFASTIKKCNVLVNIHKKSTTCHANKSILLVLCQSNSQLADQII